MSSHNNPNASAIPAATLLEAIKRSLADPEKNFIAEGAEAKIYRLEGFDNLVIRVTTEDAIQGTAHIFQAEDLYEGRNLGQEIFKGQGFTINYKQSGVSPRKTIAGFIDHHVAAGTAHPQIQGVTDFWEKMANLPAASYENFLHDMNAATKAGRIIDPLNCNYLIDDQQHPPKIGWVDVAAKEGRNSPNSLEGAKGAIFSATAQVEFTNRQQEFEFGSAKYDGNPEALALQQRMDAALAKIDAKLRSAAEVTHTPLLSNDVPAYEERIGAKQLELYPAGAKTLPAHIDLQSFQQHLGMPGEPPAGGAKLFLSEVVMAAPVMSRGAAAIHAANAPIGLALGMKGLYDKLSDQHSSYHQDVQAGGVRKIAANVGLAGDVTNVVSGSVDATNGFRTALKSTTILSEVTESASGASKLLGIAGKVAGRAAIPVAIVVGVADATAAIEAKDGHRAVRAIAGTAGGILGGILSGMATGAIVGSVVPGAGTVIGAGIGLLVGIGGALATAWASSEVADKYAGDWADRKLHEHDAKPVAHAQQAPQLQGKALTAAQIDAQLAAFLPELEAKGWTKGIDGNDGHKKDGHISLAELKKALTDRHVDLASLGVTYHGHISGGEITRGLSKPEVQYADNHKKDGGAHRT